MKTLLAALLLAFAPTAFATDVATTAEENGTVVVITDEASESCGGDLPYRAYVKNVADGGTEDFCWNVLFLSNEGEPAVVLGYSPARQEFVAIPTTDFTPVEPAQ